MLSGDLRVGGSSGSRRYIYVDRILCIWTDIGGDIGLCGGVEVLRNLVWICRRLFGLVLVVGGILVVHGLVYGDGDDETGV